MLRSLFRNTEAFGNWRFSCLVRSGSARAAAAPAMPPRIDRMSEVDFPEATSALSAASSRAARATSKPTRAGLDGPERVRDRIWRDSSIRTHSVFVPPPSKPKTQRIGTRISDFTGEMENGGTKDNAETLRAPRVRREKWEGSDEICSQVPSLGDCDFMRAVLWIRLRRIEFRCASIEKLRRAGMRGTYNSGAMGKCWLPIVILCRTLLARLDNSPSRVHATLRAV